MKVIFQLSATTKKGKEKIPTRSECDIRVFFYGDRVILPISILNTEGRESVASISMDDPHQIKRLATALNAIADAQITLMEVC